jgi:hypothetical protein
MAREIISRQVLVSGRITDAITASRTRAPPRVALLRDADGRAVEHAAVRVLPDGSYAVHGDPARALPPQEITMRLEVGAEGYSPTQQLVTFTVADLARIPRQLTIGGESSEVQVIAVPRRQDVALDPLPVTLRGRVSRAEDPSQSIEDASVSITAPTPVGPVTTDADGFFTLGPAPVAETVTLSIHAPGRDPLSTEFRIDFRIPVNQGAFALEPS